MVWARYRDQKRVLQLSTLSFLVLIGQILLGMVTVKTALDPLVSTAHLAVATGLLATVMVNAFAVRRLRIAPASLLR